MDLTKSVRNEELVELDSSPTFGEDLGGVERGSNAKVKYHHLIVSFI